MESAKEARRRRIVDRGSDRLAFITGQIQSIPSSSSSSSSPPSDPLPDRSNVAPHDKDEVAGSVLPKYDATNEAARSTYETSSRTEPLQKSKTINEAIVKAFDSGCKLVPLTSSAFPTSSNPTGHNSKSPCVVNPRPNHTKIFTANKLISSIAASENIRLLCSAVIALLVVIFHHRYLVGSIIARSVIFRPVFLVLLTDITIVVGLLLVNPGSYGKTENESRRTNRDEDGWTHRVEKALEVGLVLQKAMRAAVMDCSVYGVILISGLPLMQYWSA